MSTDRMADGRTGEEAAMDAAWGRLKAPGQPPSISIRFKLDYVVEVRGLNGADPDGDQEKYADARDRAVLIACGYMQDQGAAGLVELTDVEDASGESADVVLHPDTLPVPERAEGEPPYWSTYHEEPSDAGA